MKRIEQEEKNTWNLKTIYPNIQLIEEDIEFLKQNTLKIWEQKGNLFVTVEKFEKNIEEIFLLDQKIEKLYVYAHHLLDQDITDNESQVLANKIDLLVIYVEEKFSFLNSEIIDNQENITNYLKNKKFDKYTKYFADIFRISKYILNPEEEHILSLTSEMASAPYKIYTSLVDGEFVYDDVEVDGIKEKLTSGNYNNFITRNNRNIRKMAFKNLYKPYKQFNNTLSLVYISQINQAKFYTKAKKYDSNLMKSLYLDNINVEVYENLITTINENLKINHEYVNVRKNILGYNDLHMYDLYVPLVDELDKNITYEEAKNIVKDVLSIFGEEYLNIIEEALTNRWVDLYENEGKRSGAYSGGAYGTNPFILMNYSNKINDLYTLIHELGHSAHTFLSNNNQEYQNSHYKIFVAEVASTVNELLLTKKMLKTAKTKQEKAYFLNYLLEQFRTTVLRQTMFAEFEKETNERNEKGEELVKETLNEIYYDLNKKYFGKDIIIDEEIKYEWSRIPHFYYDFYVYQYATSFCAAVEIVTKIESGDRKYIDNYLEFLKLGNSKYPLDELQTINIDLKSKEIIEKAMKEYQNILKEFTDLMEE